MEITFPPACFGNYINNFITFILTLLTSQNCMPVTLQTHISRSSQCSRAYDTPRSYDYYDDRGSRDKRGDRERSATIGYNSSGRRRYHDDRESHTRRDERERSASIGYVNKRSRHEHGSRSSRTPGTVLAWHSFLTRTHWLDTSLSMVAIANVSKI